MALQRREVRTSERFECNATASYKKLGEYISSIDLGYRSAKAKNISRGGVCVLMPAPVEKGDVLLIDVTLEGSAASINAICEVMWCCKSGECYEAGLCFINIEGKDSKCVENLGVKSKKVN
ncbi:MAG: PilZ domain-containing protein [Candidatus Goldbacteria bacterium]|nr:PilZ domain-containing protein [Candidatus Goldiibacteriota bacterium]